MNIFDDFTETSFYGDEAFAGHYVADIGIATDSEAVVATVVDDTQI